MPSLAYYNEIDPDAAAVLRQLVADGVIAPGDVDERSIEDVAPDDLRGYAQCHFFAGGGLWSVAARLAGWPDERPLWTGSCPCQPFSVAGRRGGANDPRHLWPDFHRLIRAARPPVVMGEQTASKDGRGWFDGVRDDLARDGYASRAVDLAACAINAKQVRQRLYWLAVASPHRDQSERRTGPMQMGRLKITGEAQAESYASRAKRSAEPPVCILADDVPGRVGLLGIAGNAIVPALAAEVIAAYLDTESSTPNDEAEFKHRLSPSTRYDE